MKRFLTLTLIILILGVLFAFAPATAFAESQPTSARLETTDLKYANAYVTRGGTKIRLGQYHAAITDFDKAIELDPKNVRAYFGR